MYPVTCTTCGLLFVHENFFERVILSPLRHAAVRTTASLLLSGISVAWERSRSLVPE